MTTLDPVVLKRLRAEIGEDTVSDIFTEFVDDADVQLARMQQSVAAGDLTGVRQASHALKSTALLLGLPDLAGICRELEELAGTAAGVEEVELKVARAPKAYAAARRALEKELSGS